MVSPASGWRGQKKILIKVNKRRQILVTLDILASQKENFIFNTHHRQSNLILDRKQEKDSLRDASLKINLPDAGQNGKFFPWKKAVFLPI
ncbi:MAG: hypothetical protein QME85_09320 [Candidatus Saccharicenans sp.]|nr:hypothetical protein [Candidatus Saccharicenans sp.]